MMKDNEKPRMRKDSKRSTPSEKKDNKSKDVRFAFFLLVVFRSRSASEKEEKEEDEEPRP